MAETTHISWADSTLNIWMGCTKVSNGPKGACEGCYAQVLVEERFGLAAWGPHAERVEAKGWRAHELRKISRLAKAAGCPWFVFVNSLSDFWDNQADPALRMEALAAFEEHPHLTFLLLTKRPQNIIKLFDGDTDFDGSHDERADHWPPNVAIGCTVVTQAEADRDIPFLLAAKAALNPALAFVSMEPLMGAVRLWKDDGGSGYDYLNGGWYENEDPAVGPGPHHASGIGPKLDWVITGGETDQGAHKARPSHPDWFRGLRDQCAAAGVPLHFKQWGEWAPGENVPRDRRGRIATAWQFNDRWEFDSETYAEGEGRHIDDEPDLYRVGKKAAGRLLDGEVHDARPVVATLA